MITLNASTDLLELAKKTVWFKDPTESLRHPYHFIAHVLTYGSFDDVEVLKKYVSAMELKVALKNAPPGIFDPRSWAYWNIIMGENPPPALPKRKIP